MIGAPDSEAWWDVPVAEVAELESTQAARAQYERDKRTQKQYLSPGERVRSRDEHHHPQDASSTASAARETPGSSTRTAPVYDPATGEQQAEVVLADARTSTPRCRPPRRRSRPGATCRSRAARG